MRIIIGALVLLMAITSFSSHHESLVALAQTQGKADIQVILSPKLENSSPIHDNDKITVQWKAFNAGTNDSQAFHDMLVVTSIPEGCTSIDSQKDHPVVYNSETDTSANTGDFSETPIAPQHAGDLKTTMVGPFPAGDYLFTITLGKDVYNTQADGDCVTIVPADNSGSPPATQ